MTLANSHHNDHTSTSSHGLIFTLFNRLPIELRLKIWEAALPDPRVINIRKKRLMKLRAHVTVAVASDTKAPSLLFACRESYSVASRSYIPCFSFAQSIPLTYFDLQRDTLYIRCDRFALPYGLLYSPGWFGDTMDELEYLDDSANLQRVQNLAVLLDPDRDHITNTQFPECILADMLVLFGNVRNLTVVLGHFDRPGDDQGDILLMEPIDVAKTCYNYETISSETSPRQDVLDVPLNTNLVSPAELEVALQELKSQQEEMNQNVKRQLRPVPIHVVKLGHLPVPHIEYKSAVTRGLKDHLDSLRIMR